MYFVNKQIYAHGAFCAIAERLVVLFVCSSDRYQLTLWASDCGTPARSSNLSVLVVVDDANDNSPVFAVDEAGYEVTVPADLPRGSFVTRVLASDRDSGLNARISYRFAARTQVRL